MVSRMVVIAEAVPLAMELMENALEQLDEVTRTAGKPFYMRASNILSLALGAGATIAAIFGDRLGIPEDMQIVSAMLGGKFLGRFVRQAIEYYSAKAAVAQAAAKLAQVKLGAPTVAGEKKAEAVAAPVEAAAEVVF